MKNTFWLTLSALALAILTALSCTTAATPAVTEPAEPANIQKPEIKPPEILDIRGPKEAPLSENATYVCLVTDPDGRKLTLEWSAEEGTLYPEGGMGIVWLTPDRPGSYELSVKVTNDAGLSASMSKTFVMVEKPETHQYTDTTIYLKLTSAGSETVNADCRVMTFREIECSVEGKEPDQLTYKWSAPIGKLDGNGLDAGKASRVGWIAPGTPGQYTVSVVVADQSGTESRGKVVFEVYAK